MGVGYHQAHPGEPAGSQRAQEALPERLALAVADVTSQDLPVAVCGDAGGHDHRHRGDLRDAVAHLEIGRVQIDVGELDMVQAPAPERLDCLVEPRADARHLRLRYPRLRAQSGHQIVHRSGGHPGHICLHDDRVQRPVDAPARLEHRAGASCRPALRQGVIDEVQQAGFDAGFDTRGHAGGHPQRSFPSNSVTLTAISLSASPRRATSSRAITSSGSGPSARAPGRDDANASSAPRLATSRARMIVASSALIRAAKPAWRDRHIAYAVKSYRAELDGALDAPADVERDLLSVFRQATSGTSVLELELLHAYCGLESPKPQHAAIQPVPRKRRKRK